MMSQTISAPAPEPNALPTPAGVAAINNEPDSSPTVQPASAPVPTDVGAPVAEPPPAPEVLTGSIAVEEKTTNPAAIAEPTPAPDPTTVTSPPAAITAGAAPEPTLPSTLPAVVALSEPTASPEPPTGISDQQPTPAATGALPEPTATLASSTTVASESMPAATPTTSPVAVEPPAVAPALAEQPEDGALKSTEDSSAEPESPLTNKFTENEWAALKEFRGHIPSIFAEAFPDKEKAANTPIKIWGVEIDPNNLRADARVSVILMKFLRARNLSIPDTSDKLIGTLRWRESFNLEAALAEEFPQDIFGNLAHISGTDTEGRPVVYNIYGGNQDMKAVFGDVQRFIRWRVALMEKSVVQLDFTTLDQMIQIHDYEGVSLTSRDANSKAAASEATNIFQNHYPEILYKKFFVNVPTLFNWIFWVFKPLISANTLAKMSVVGTSQHAIKKALSDYIVTTEIPQRYGGEGEAF